MQLMMGNGWCWYLHDVVDFCVVYNIVMMMYVDDEEADVDVDNDGADAFIVQGQWDSRRWPAGGSSGTRPWWPTKENNFNTHFGEWVIQIKNKLWLMDISNFLKRNKSKIVTYYNCFYLNTLDIIYIKCIILIVNVWVDNMTLKGVFMK